MRLIAGRHRGRQLAFPDRPGLRPTTDRVRETLFNWLAPTLPGRRCLDLFAGSGSLAFEALSRGAARAVLVESDAAAHAALVANADLLGLTEAEIIRADARRWLTTADLSGFDLLFLDPPFASDLLTSVVAALAQRADTPALLTLEEAAEAPATALPESWAEVRSAVYGDTRFRLIRTRPDS